MRLEFDFERKDSLKKNRLMNGKRISTVLFTIVCGVLQIAVAVMFRDAPVLLFSLIFLSVYGFLVIRLRLKHRYPPYHCEIDFHETYFTEKSNNTIYQKSYRSLDSVKDIGDHVVLNHIGSLSIIPKRVLNSEQLDWLVNEIGNRVTTSQDIPVPFYEEHLKPNQSHSHNFTWTQKDVDQLIIEQFALFDPAREFEADAVKPNNKKTASNRSVTWLFLIYAIILIAMSVRFWTLLYTPTIAFLLGYMGLREVIRMQEVRSRTIQANGLVGKESQFYIDSDTVWIGKTQIVNRHALSDISKVHYGANFVGLQSHENVMFILPKRSIGNDSEVYRFMAQVSVKLQNTVQIETDNPYQPPSN